MPAVACVRFASPVASRRSKFSAAGCAGKETTSPRISSPLDSPGLQSPRVGNATRVAHYEIPSISVQSGITLGSQGDEGSHHAAIAARTARYNARMARLNFDVAGRGLGLTLDLAPQAQVMQTKQLSAASSDMSSGYSSDAKTITPDGTPRLPQTRGNRPRLASVGQVSQAAERAQAFRRRATPFPKAPAGGYFDAMIDEEEEDENSPLLSGTPEPSQAKMFGAFEHLRTI